MAIAKTLAEAKPLIADLVARFRVNAAEYTRAGSKYNETELRVGFLNPFFQALGWDVQNEKGQTQDLREVVHEATVEGDERSSKKPDYEMRLARQRKFFAEAKKPSVNIEVDKAPAFQTRRYGFSAGMPISILTNFFRFIVYDCVPIPGETDEPHIARLDVYTFEELESKVDEIYDSFSREAVYEGRFDEKYKVDVRHRGTSQFDRFFLAQVKGWRKRLAEDIASHDPTLSGEELTHIVQRLINRIVFLRICEDRELERYETLKKLEKAQTYATFKVLLKEADKKYNSGLFSLIDDPSLGVDIGDEVLLSIIEELYYPQGPYTFAVVDPAMLGNIYELFLGQEIVVERSGRVRIVEKPEVKASGGVAATPSYVVDQIVERTISPKALRACCKISS